jgi:hypothetical protein
MLFACPVEGSCLCQEYQLILAYRRYAALEVVFRRKRSIVLSRHSNSVPGRLPQSLYAPESKAHCKRVTVPAAVAIAQCFHRAIPLRMPPLRATSTSTIPVENNSGACFDLQGQGSGHWFFECGFDLKADCSGGGHLNVYALYSPNPAGCCQPTSQSDFAKSPVTHC